MTGPYLVDSHTFLWWTLKQPGLSKPAITVLEDNSNEIVLSAATCWEMLIKYRLGKLALPDDLADDIEATAVSAGFRLLPIYFVHAQRTALLPQFKDHKDPFDRLLIAQAQVEGMTLVSNEEIFDRYGVLRVW